MMLSEAFAAGEPSTATVTWFQLGVALVAGGSVAALLNGLFNRKQLGASATKIITDAAASVTGSMTNRLKELEDKDELREAEWRSLKTNLFRHEGWDRKVVSKLRALDPNVEIEDPPPLYPTNEENLG